MKTFSELNLIAPVLRALADENYDTPTPIQAQTIPAALRGRDVLGCAQTGTGKTAAFALPILNKLGKQSRKATANSPYALVLSPTRELAIQIGESFSTYGKHLHLRQAVVYGGVHQRKQVRDLNRGAHLLIATPGRLLDLMNQGHLQLNQLKFFVLDEADRMLDMGFLPDLRRIIGQLPEQRQSLFFSATLPSSIVSLSRSLLHNPVSITVTPSASHVEKIEQRIMFVERGAKKALLRKILAGEDIQRALVFTKTKRTANVLEKQLVRNGFKAAAIHGDKSQNARQRVLQSFRSKKIQVLVATDVAARGIDIDRITHVVNFDMPIEPESYVHRIGRTGRAGAAGVALSLCCPDEHRELRLIERLIGRKVPVDNDHPQPTSQHRDPASPRRPRRRGAPKPRPSSKRAVTAGFVDDPSTDSVPERAPHGKRQTRRKGARNKQRAKRSK